MTKKKKNPNITKKKKNKKQIKKKIKKKKKKKLMSHWFSKITTKDKKDFSL